MELRRTSFIGFLTMRKYAVVYFTRGQPTDYQNFKPNYLIISKIYPLKNKK